MNIEFRNSREDSEAWGLHAPGKQSEFLQYQCGHNVPRCIFKKVGEIDLGKNWCH